MKMSLKLAAAAVLAVPAVSGRPVLAWEDCQSAFDYCEGAQEAKFYPHGAVCDPADPPMLITEYTCWDPQLVVNLYWGTCSLGPAPFCS